MRTIKDSRTIFRTFCITMFMIICASVGLVVVGHIFSVVEMNAFGNHKLAFGIVNDEEFIIFGNKVRFPIIKVFIYIYDFIRQYAPGIIKLLGFAVNGAEELIENGVYKTVSSLK